MRYRIVEATSDHHGALKRCLTYLQDVEASLEADRIAASSALAEQCLKYLLSQCDLKSGKILVALVDHDVAGFVSVWCESDSDNFISSLISYGYISDIAVLPEYQRSGIAQNLMAQAESYAKTLGVRWCKVGVLAKNFGAVRLYEKCGFQQHEISLVKRLADT